MIFTSSIAKMTTSGAGANSDSLEEGGAGYGVIVGGIASLQLIVDQ